MMSTMSWTVLNDLRLQGRFCDVVIEVNGTEFNAHKNILCGCSSYFRVLFTRWSDSEKQVYSISGVSPDMMRLIIEYAYTCFVPVTAENVEKLLAAANQFRVTGVVGACCDFLEGQLSLENCVGILRFADIYCCPDLRRKAYLFILYNFEEMARVSEEFVELSVQQLVDIVQRDDLNVKKEEVVFEAILRWIDHSREDRKTHIPVLLSKVRLGLMTPDSFMNNVRNHALVRDSIDCKPIIISALTSIYDLTTDRLSDASLQNPLTCLRMPHEVLLATGGWSGGGATNGIEAYDVRANRWVNVTVDVESPRAYHGAAYVSGFVYCIGGFDGTDYFSSVRKFNPVTHSWQQGAPMHSPRCYVSVAVLSGRIYAMGGFDGHVRLNTAEHYEPETNQWTQLSPMHEQRSDASATALHGKVYICGGFNGNECLFTAECYNPETNQWTLIAPMRSRRSGVGVITYGEQVYAVGGFDGANRLRSVEAYNPTTNSWRAVPSILNARSNFGVEVLDDLLFVAGGFDGFTTISSVECYDEKSDEWFEAEDMEIHRSALSCCVMHGLPNVSQYAAPRGALQCPLEEEEEAAGGSI